MDPVDDLLGEVIDYIEPPRRRLGPRSYQLQSASQDVSSSLIQ